MRPTRVEVMTLDKHQATGAAVAFEAQKGYDFLIIGVDSPVSASGEFCPELERAAGGFDGPMAVVIGRGQHIADPRESGVRILLPVTGTAASRRAAEVAVTIARADKIPITALYVATNATEAQSRQNRWRPVSPAPPEEEAILKDVMALADRYHIPVRTAIRAEIAPHQAIRQEAQKAATTSSSWVSVAVRAAHFSSARPRPRHWPRRRSRCCWCRVERGAKKRANESPANLWTAS
jgi:nucleotide-binding universal stress UspA family protein